MQFAIPLLLGGAALLIAPWLIHHIRKPEREPIRFSSLMFLPDVKKEVIERRKLQHILLMILRMALLLLLALAFARPYLPVRETYVQETTSPTKHLIALDLSYSMGMGDRFDEARAKVNSILSEIPQEIPVGMVGFADQPRTLVPFGDSAASSRKMVESVLGDLEPSQGATRFDTALQYAETLLLENTEEGAQTVLHFVSDFGRQGMPEINPDWRLSGRVLFRGYTVGDGPARNLSLMELGKRIEADDYVVAGKIKNWSKTNEESVTVALYLGEERIAEQAVTVSPNGASQVRFKIDNPGEQVRDGRLVLEDDAFNLDNTRYFIWKAKPQKEIIIVAEDKDVRWQPHFFIQNGLTYTGRAPWVISRMQPGNLERAVSQSPDLIILQGGGSVKQGDAARLKSYAEGGGRLLAVADENPFPAGFLNTFGLTDGGMRDERSRQLGWIDFTGIRFKKRRALQLTDPNREGVQIAAKYVAEDDGAELPALMEFQVGQGSAVFWSFSPELAWTNLPKHPKFVPLLQETVAYLIQLEADDPNYFVGAAYAHIARRAKENLRLPDGEEHAQDPGAPANRIMLARAGILSKQEGQNGDWTPYEAVNLAGGESDPETIQVEEFALRLTSNGGTAEGAAHAELERYSGEFENRKEYGYPVIVLLLALLGLELFYANRKSLREEEE